MKDFYERYWQERVKKSGTGISGVAEARLFFIKYLLPDKYELGRVLDAGCGNGTTLHLLKSVYHFDAYGIDISQTAVDLAQRMGIEAKAADITENIPFPDGYFDVVICSEVLEHLLLLERALQEIQRVGKDEAIFIFSVPNVATIWNRLRFLLGKTVFDQGRFSSGEHLHFYTKNSFERLLGNSGFRIDKVIGRRGNKITRFPSIAGTLFVRATKVRRE